MNVQEITKRLYAIGDAILEKTGEMSAVKPSLTIRDDMCSIFLYDGEYNIFATAKGDTPEAALDAADAIIAALPSIEKMKLQAHLERVADCVDKAKADNIADEYVNPLRMTVAAMTANLLVHVPEPRT